MAPYVSELWVFPIKSAQGTRVRSAEMAPTGFELDRKWCIIDVRGDRYRAGEYLSQRKMKCLAKVGVKIGDDHLTVTAEGMPELKVPISESHYESNEDVEVSCGGHSTTDPENGSWELGKINGKYCGAEAEEWFTKFLNEADSGKESLPRAQYKLVRMMNKTMRRCTDFAGKNIIKEKANLPGAVTAHFNVREGDGVAFQDYAPFLMTSSSSCRDLDAKMGTKGYPVLSFRGSIVVDGCDPWEEETWTEFKVGPYLFRKIKECPRCSIPCRDQTTGEFVFSKSGFDGVRASSLFPTMTLRKMFPAKAADAEWGIWKGPFMGVYVGHDSQEGSIEEGMPITVLKREKTFADKLCSIATVAAPVAAAVAASLMWLRR
eukprot:TRINITY_DN7676_c0_g1_i1.p1 TRINITY_DN7676_c0_g1~~TRINITY_DN7676_c0_g1_i1.p1  ORF type:complete len:375 (+),score=61.32 TRINITY_DN7676_c0_g1_i1:45-1169(+)